MNCSSHAAVASVDGPSRPAFNRLILAGRECSVPQDHLIEPFAAILSAVDQLAGYPAKGSAPEATLLGLVYSSLYRFFQILLPSAGHDILHDLTYSLSLLLAREAIEANERVVEASNTRSATGSQPVPQGAAR